MLKNVKLSSRNVTWYLTTPSVAKTENISSLSSSYHFIFFSFTEIKVRRLVCCEGQVTWLQIFSFVLENHKLLRRVSSGIEKMSSKSVLIKKERILHNKVFSVTYSTFFFYNQDKNFKIYFGESFSLLLVFPVYVISHVYNSTLHFLYISLPTCFNLSIMLRLASFPFVFIVQFFYSNHDQMLLSKYVKKTTKVTKFL